MIAESEVQRDGEASDVNLLHKTGVCKKFYYVMAMKSAYATMIAPVVGRGSGGARLQR